MDISKKVWLVCVTYVFQDVICDAFDQCHAMCYTLLTVTGIRSIRKITKIRNLETMNRMEGDTEDATVQGSKDKDIELITRKVTRKRKGIYKKKLSDALCESNIKTIAEELVLSEKS